MRLLFGDGARRAPWTTSFPLFLCACAVVLAAVDAFGQDRRTRSDRGGGSGGYGQSSGDRGAPAGREGREGRSRTTAGAPSDDDKPEYPARERPAGRPLAEYQKPSYDHHRFVVSPDGSKIALSGRHIEKENAGKPNEKPKRDSTGRPIVLANVLEVIDVATGKQIALFKPPALFENLALSPDNQFLAAEAPDRPGVVYVLHLPTRKSKEFKTELRRIVPGGIVFSKEGRSIHVVAPDRLKTIALGNGESKELKYEIPSPVAVYSAETNLLAVGVVRSKQGRPEVQIYDVAEGKQTEQLTIPSGPTCLGFSPDGKFLAATVVGGAIRTWQTSDWTTVESVAARIGFQPGQLAVSAEGDHVAVRPRTIGRDEMRVINLSSGETVQTIDSRDVFFMPSGMLAIANNAGPFYMEVGSGTVTEFPGGDAALAESTASAEGAEDASVESPAPQVGYGVSSRVGYGAAAIQADTSEEGATAESSPPVRGGYGLPSTLSGASNVGYGAPSSAPAADIADNDPTRPVLVTGPERQPDQWISLASEQAPPVSEDPNARTSWEFAQGSYDIAVSGNGTKLVRRQIWRKPSDGVTWTTLDYYDLTNGQRIFGKRGGDVRAMAWSHNGDYLVAREQNGHMSVFHVPTTESKINIYPPSREGRLVAISNDGKTIYTEHGSSVAVINPPDEIRLTEKLRPPVMPHKLVKLPGTPTGMAFWPERNEAVCAFNAMAGKSSASLAVFALPDNKPIKTIDLPSPGTTVSYSPDGRFLAVGMNNGQISVFTTAEWSAAVTFDGGDPSGYRNIAISSGAKFVVANPADENNGGLMMWRVIGGRKLPKTLFSTGHAFINETILAKAAPEAPVMFHDLQSNRDVWPWEKPGDAPVETADAAAEETEADPPVRTIITGYGASEADKEAARQMELEKRNRAAPTGRR